MTFQSVDEAIEHAHVASINTPNVQKDESLNIGFHHFAAAMERNGWEVIKYIKENVVIAVCRHSSDEARHRTYINSHGLREEIIIQGLPDLKYQAMVMN
jgi:hypothetical protein